MSEPTAKMTEAEGNGQRCAYVSPASGKQADGCCTYDAWEGSSEGFCIYHARENSTDPAVAREVWKEARRVASMGECHFVGWHFPKDPDHTCFDNQQFEGVADFRWATFEMTTFFKAAFHDEAHFANASFHIVSFSCVHFRGRAEFRESRCFRFFDCSFCAFHSLAGFCSAVFEDKASFHYTHFSHANFRSTAFGKYTYFAGAVFDRASFDHSVNTGEFVLIEPFPEKVLHAADMEEHLETLSHSAVEPFKREHDGIIPYRMAKDSARRLGDGALESECHYKERCAMECALRRDYARRPLTVLFWRWLFDATILRRVFGYGERPLRVFLSSLLLICACGVLYLGGGLRENGVESACGIERVLSSLYFSFVTFTTLGYGDIHPIGWCRLLAGVEAFIGALMMAAFTISLFNRYAR